MGYGQRWASRSGFLHMAASPASSPPRAHPVTGDREGETLPTGGSPSTRKQRWRLPPHGVEEWELREGIRREDAEEGNAGGGGMERRRSATLCDGASSFMRWRCGGGDSRRRSSQGPKVVSKEATTAPRPSIGAPLDLPNFERRKLERTKT
jgi:hypothetical protein